MVASRLQGRLTLQGGRPAQSAPSGARRCRTGRIIPPRPRRAAARLFAARLFAIGLLAAGLGVAAQCGPAQAADEAVPGQWGITDTSNSAAIVWPSSWVGAHTLRAQWFKILAESPEAWLASGRINHAKGEPPDNTYYLWRYDQPLPEGTRILIEGDFPHARMMSFQVCAPWNDRALVTADGVGLQEIHILDEDIVPDPGHTNPFLPGASRKAEKRHFHITFELRDGDPVALNPKAAVPPYRASGNLRVGCTGTAAHGKLFGAPKSLGPVVYMRMYLPDHYAPFGGVEPPVIRLQLPGKPPELAPISRGMPVNLRKFITAYSLADNPARDSGLSVKEEEANKALRDYAARAVADEGKTSGAAGNTQRMFAGPDGVIGLYKSFQTPWLMTYFKDYLKDPEGCRSALPRRYRAAFGAMGPDAPPPGNDEHVSDHHSYNTYLVGAAALEPGQLLVFHGKAPRTPHTLNGDGVMGESSQLRYWNLSMHAGNPTRLTAVVNVTDETAVVDRNGDYTIVIGRDQDRPAGATTANGITWRSWPAGAVLSLSWRLMSSAATVWEHAPQHITWAQADTCTFGRNPAAVRSRMGPYYPEGRYLTAAQVDKLAGGQPWTAVVGAGVAPGPKAPAELQTAAGQVQAERMPMEPAAGQTAAHEIAVDGKRRSYLLHLPSAAGKSAFPAVIVLHGGQMGGAEMERLTGMSPAADKAGFAAVYPNAIGQYQGKTYWNDGRIPEVDDVRFIAAVIDDLTRNAGINAKRIFVTGYSNGASMANRLAVELSARIAAIAPVAGTIPTRLADTWRPSRPVPVLYFHGTDDPFAYYTGGSAGTRRGSALSADDYIAWWGNRDGCTGAAAEHALPEQTGSRTKLVRIAHTLCKEGAEVVFYRIVGGGHTWPGRSGVLPEASFGPTATQIDANDLMLRFFQQHPMR